MATVLRVVRPFGGRKVGDVIDDPAGVREALGGAHKNDVVRVAAPEPAAAKSKEA